MREGIEASDGMSVREGIEAAKVDEGEVSPSPPPPPPPAALGPGPGIFGAAEPLDDAMDEPGGGAPKEKLAPPDT